MTDNAVRYRRILLKLSGESFRGDKAFGIDPRAVSYLASQIKAARDLGVEMGVVVGGGNILRGAEEAEAGSMDRAAADYAGMLGTLINALTLQDALERQFSVDTRVQSAINVQQVAEPYIQRRAVRPSREGQGCRLRLRHREPIHDYRHRRRAALGRDGREGNADGEAQCRRRVLL